MSSVINRHCSSACGDEDQQNRCVKDAYEGDNSLCQWVTSLCKVQCNLNTLGQGLLIGSSQSRTSAVVWLF